MRVRAFTQDDAHIFCTEEQIADECQKINELILSVYSDFGFDKIVVKLSTRPEKRVGTDAMWDHAEAVMSAVLDEIKARHGNVVTTALNPGEGAFYGPKFEYMLRDAIGREWQCGTTQVDFNLPDRFGAFYIAANSEKKTPVMIHRAICGSLERFIGILIEHYAGHLPLWLAPVQIVVCTITQDADDYALEVVAAGAQARACASRSICATRRSTTRCASIRLPRFRCCSSSGARRRASARSRSAVSARTRRRRWRWTRRSRRSSRKLCRRTSGKTERRRSRRELSASLADRDQ